MGDYGVGLASQVRSLSPVDLNVLSNNQSLFPPGRGEIDPVNIMHQVHDDHHNGIGMNGGINGVHLNTDNHSSLTDTFMQKKSEIICLDDKQSNSNDVNSVAVSLTQLGLSENNVNVLYFFSYCIF